MANTPETITSEEKKLITKGIIEGCLSLMKEIITKKSAKDRAKKWSEPHSQAKTNVTRDTILFNVLTGKQHFPALPRHFRSNLEEEKNIRRWDLTKGILNFMVKNHIMRNRGGCFSYSRGRPSRFLADERRGRIDSYYEPSRIKQVIDEVLTDSEAIREIDDALIESEMLYEFLKYSFETALYEIKISEEAFRNSYKLAVIKYGILSKKKDELDESWILVKDISEVKLKALARAHAHDAIHRFKIHDKSVLYTIAGLIYLVNGYDSETPMP
jgi:hypothetical protein